MRAEGRVSLFFINRPIKQGRRLSPRPRLGILFRSTAFPRARAILPSPRLRLLLLAAFSLVSFDPVPFSPRCPLANPLHFVLSRFPFSVA